MTTISSANPELAQYLRWVQAGMPNPESSALAMDISQMTPEEQAAIETGGMIQAGGEEEIPFEESLLGKGVQLAKDIAGTYSDISKMNSPGSTGHGVEL